MVKVTRIVSRLIDGRRTAVAAPASAEPDPEPHDAAMLREAWRAHPGRAAQVQATLRSAHQDHDFLGHVMRGDAARDAGAWTDAEHCYAQALALYPMHPGYRVQLGHVLKEQGRFAAAELHYRTVWALGAGDSDLRRHLRFVCRVQGVRAAEPPTPRRSADPLFTAPTVMDLEALAALFWPGAPAPDDMLVAVMRRAATCEDAALAMIADPRFAERNRVFLEILGEGE